MSQRMRPNRPPPLFDYETFGVSSNPTSNIQHQKFNTYQSKPMKITSAIITAMPRPMPFGMFDPMPEVVATFEDGSSKNLFSFYPDEISFQASEFIGLTEAEAKSLFHRRDISFLQS